jgi:hypothetical protein
MTETEVLPAIAAALNRIAVALEAFVTPRQSKEQVDNTNLTGGGLFPSMQELEQCFSRPIAGRGYEDFLGSPLS